MTSKIISIKFARQIILIILGSSVIPISILHAFFIKDYSFLLLPIYITSAIVFISSLILLIKSFSTYAFQINGSTITVNNTLFARKTLINISNITSVNNKGIMVRLNDKTKTIPLYNISINDKELLIKTIREQMIR